MSLSKEATGERQMSVLTIDAGTVAITVYLALNFFFPPHESFVDEPVHDIQPSTVSEYGAYGNGDGAYGGEDPEKYGR